MFIMVLAVIVALFVWFVQRCILNGPVPFYDKEIGALLLVLATSEKDETITLLIRGKRRTYLLPEGACMPRVGTLYRLDCQDGLFRLHEVPKPLIMALQSVA